MSYLTSIMSGLNIAPSLYGDAAKRILTSLGIAGGDDSMSALLQAIRESATGGSASLASLLGRSAGDAATAITTGSLAAPVGGRPISYKSSSGNPLSGLAGLDLSSVGLDGGLLSGFGGMGGGFGNRIEIKQDRHGRFYLCPRRQEQIYFTAHHPYDYIKIKTHHSGKDYYRCLRDDRRIFLV